MDGMVVVMLTAWISVRSLAVIIDIPARLYTIGAISSS
jgi:hypothetical protein